MGPILKLIFLSLMLVASSAALSREAGAEDPLLVFSASSLTNVVSELAQRFEQQNDQKTVVSFAATSVLAKQIKDGAPAHVFIGANKAWMDDLITSEAILTESVETISANRLILIISDDFSSAYEPRLDELSPTDNLASIAPGLPIAIGNPEHVPVGIYARQALSRLGFWEALKSRLVPMPNARSVLASVARGETALGIVYASDAISFEAVNLLGLFPADTHAPIHYPAGVVADNPHPMAMKFLRFLVSSEAKNVFKELGFLPPPS